MANGSSEGELAARRKGQTSLQVEPHGLDKLVDELIPGIPNDITVGNIVTRLPIADVFKIPLISRAWQQAVQSREVLSERLRQHKADPLRVVPVVDLSTTYIYQIRLALHSSDDKFFETLPAIPRSWTMHDQVIYRFMCFAGRIHVLVINLRYSTIRTTVYMFDVTRGGQTWTECAQNQVIIRLHSRSQCCLKDNKFYVSGDLFPVGVCPGHMIYDPDLDSWSSTTDFQQEASTDRCICTRSTHFSTHEVCFV